MAEDALKPVLPTVCTEGHGGEGSGKGKISRDGERSRQKVICSVLPQWRQRNACVSENGKIYAEGESRGIQS